MWRYDNLPPEIAYLLVNNYNVSAFRLQFHFIMWIKRAAVQMESNGLNKLYRAFR